MRYAEDEMCAWPGGWQVRKVSCTQSQSKFYVFGHKIGRLATRYGISPDEMQASDCPSGRPVHQYYGFVDVRSSGPRLSIGPKHRPHRWPIVPLTLLADQPSLFVYCVIRPLWRMLPCGTRVVSPGHRLTYVLDAIE